MKRAILVLAMAVTVPALAQEAGWHYSPLSGEGDRAALGCSANSTPVDFSCIAVRCEDDHSVALHIHTSRAGGDDGSWTLQFDREFAMPIEAEATDGPYGARVVGDVAPLVDLLRVSGLVYLDRPDNAPIARQIPLTGSLNAINRALFFCAPRAAE